MTNEQKIEARKDLIRRALDEELSDALVFRRRKYVELRATGPCRVCAIGSLVRVWQGTVEETIGGERQVPRRILSDLYTSEELNLFEEAFESNLGDADTVRGNLPVYAHNSGELTLSLHYVLNAGPKCLMWPLLEARVWGLHFQGSVRARGRAILRNALEHDGLFTPPPVSQEEAKALFTALRVVG